MNEIELKLNQYKQGAFAIYDGDELLAELRIGITHNYLIAYHTEVSDKLKGQGISKKLVDTMVAYARQHQLKVIALCPFVNTLFKRNADLYADVWEKDFNAIEY